MRQAGLVGLLLSAASAASDDLVIHKKPVHDISPRLYGIFFEDINFAADGGIYAELIRNRDFEVLGRGNVGEDGDLLRGRVSAPPPSLGDMRPWAATGEKGLEVSLTNATHPFAANPTVLHIKSASGGGVSNPGYWGISTREAVPNHLSLFARSDSPAKLDVRLVGGGGKVLAQATVAIQGDWREYKEVLTPSAGDAASTLQVRCAGGCDVFLDHVSLFPGDAVRGLFRKDLFDKLKGIQPAFVRFPGGNYLEGMDLPTRWAWKHTVGPRQARPGHFNSAWGYWVTDGLGLYEYLALCEELAAEPQLSVYTGFSISQGYVPMSDSGPFVQDAVDAIEFANGGPSSKYGKMRAEAGHESSFGLKLFEVGNEEKDMDNYKSHFKAISAAIRAAQPNATIIGSGRWGPTVVGNPCISGDHCDLWDDHYYRDPDTMANMSHVYDSYSRTLPKVFVGEYAANVGQNLTLRGALAEALFMIGFENNADVVRQASFAPLFAHVRGTQWVYDLILYNASSSFGIPSFHVQQLFARNLGTQTLAVEGGGALLKDRSCSIGEDGTVWLKLVSYGGPGGPLRIRLPDMEGYSDARISKLAGDPSAENSLEAPLKVSPVVEHARAAHDGSFTVQVEPWSLLVVELRPSPVARYV